MDGHPARQIVAGASAGRDAGRLAGDRGHRARFREPGHGFLWAWDEEVAAGEGRLLERQSVPLAVECLVAAGALAEAVPRRDVPRAVGPEDASSDALDAKVVVEQGAVPPEQLARQGQRDVPRLALRARW
jgi:hypothetical protein